MGRVWKGGWWVARAPYHRISWFTTLEDCHKIDFLQVLNLLMKGNTGCQTYYVQKLPLLSSRSLIRQFEKPHSKELQQWLSSFSHVVVSGRSSTGWEDDSYKVPICWQLSLWSQNIQGCWPHQPNIVSMAGRQFQVDISIRRPLVGSPPMQFEYWSEVPLLARFAGRTRWRIQS